MRLYNEALSIPKSVFEKLSIVLPFAIVLLIAAVGVYFRVHLSFHVNGDYFGGNDPYRYVRQVRQIVSEGDLPSVDFMRNYPDGVKTPLNRKGFPWFIAQCYKLLNKCFPAFSLNKIMALYPVVAIVLSGFVYFLFVNKYFNFLTASLATLAFLTAPPIIGRTTVGYVDADSLVIFLFLLTLFFYRLSLDDSTFPKQVTYKLICFSILGLTGFLWMGIGLIAVMIFGCDFFIGIYRGFDKKQAATSILGISLYLGFLFFPASVYYESFLQPFALSAVIPAFLVGLLYIGTLIRPNRFHLTDSIQKVISPKGVVSIVLLLAFPIYWLRGTIISICEHLLFPFGSDPIMRAVSELRPIGLSEWWDGYGLLYPVGLIGFCLFASEHCFGKRQPKNSRLHVTIFSLEIFSIILSRAFTPFLLRQSLWISLSVLIVPIGWAIFHISYLVVRNGDKRALPFIIWFLVGFSFNSSAARFSLFFAPIFVLMGSFCFVKALKYFIHELEEKIELDSLFVITMIAWLLFLCGSDLFTLILRVFGVSFDISTRNRLLITFGFSLIPLGVFIERLTSKVGARVTIGKLCGFLVTCTFCFLAYTGVYRLGIGQTGYVNAKAPIRRIEKFAYRIRENTPPNAVIAANWNYGSIINEIGQRATIIDEEQNLNRIRSYYRQVIFGKTSEEILNFLREHQATHLMLTTDELSALNQHWQEAHPNQPAGLPFVIPLESSKVDHPAKMIVGFTPFRKFVPALYQDPTASEQLQVSKIIVEFTNSEGYITILTPPQVICGEGDSSKSISLREVIMGSKQWYFPEAELPITIWLDASFGNEPQQNLGFDLYHAFLLTPKAYELNAVRLFLNELKEHFEEIITEDNNHAKVWEIHY